MGQTLVTGGLGFVGSHLVDQLIAAHHDVVIVDNKTSAVVDANRELQTSNVVVSDVIAYRPPKSMVFDQIFHLADIAGPFRIIEYAGTIGPRSISGLESVLRLGTPGHTQFVFVSSSEIYGRAGRYAESDPAVIYTPYTIRLEYAVSKSLCEISALNYGRRTGLDVKVVRPFNIAGPRQSGVGGFVLPRFFDAALSGEPLTVFGDGTQVRSFTHVLDTVESILRIAESDVAGQIFNSGNHDNKITILDLAMRVKNICNSGSPIQFVDPKTIFGELYAESFDKLPNTDKIERVLGWRARRSLDDILRDTFNEKIVENGKSVVVGKGNEVR